MTTSTDSTTPDAVEPTTPGVSRKTFLTTAAKAVAGAAVAGAALESGSVLAAGQKAHLPEIMRKGSQVTLTYYFGANPAEAQVRQRIFNRFMAANPDIKIVSQLDGTTHLQKFNTEVAGGNPPDLTMSWELDYPAYAKRGVYMDLHQFIKHDSQFQHQVMSQEYPAVLHMFSQNGKLYVLPEQITDTVLYYNKDHMAAAGLKMPTSWDDKTWTWDKFLSYAKKLTQTSGGRVSRYGYAEMWGWGLTAANVVAAANGGNWFKQAVDPKAGSSNLASHNIPRRSSGTPTSPTSTRSRRPTQRSPRSPASSSSWRVKRRWVLSDTGSTRPSQRPRGSTSTSPPCQLAQGAAITPAPTWVVPASRSVQKRSILNRHGVS